MKKKKYSFVDVSIYSRDVSLNNILSKFYDDSILFWNKLCSEFIFFILLFVSVLFLISGFFFSTLSFIFFIAGLFFLLKGIEEYKLFLVKKDFEENGIF